MDGINPRPASRESPTPAAASESTPPEESTRDDRGMMCGMGRSTRFMTLAIVAVAVIVGAGL